MADLDLGRVTPIYRGEFNYKSDYELNDIVRYKGNMYWHISKDVTTGIYPNNETVWSVVLCNDTGLIDINNKLTVYAPAYVDRKLGGTRIKNSFWVSKASVLCGESYSEEENMIYLYFLWSTPDDYGARFESRVLYDTNSEEEPYELTLENAPHNYNFKSANAYDLFKGRTFLDVDKLPYDIRIVRVVFDEDDNIIDTIYSAQYRITMNNGVITRTRVITEPTSEDHIIDIGLMKMGNSTGENFNSLGYGNYFSLIPLVNVQQPTPWYLIINDSSFENAPYGLEMCIVNGLDTTYRGLSVYKAEETGGEIPPLPEDSGRYLLEYEDNGSTKSIKWENVNGQLFTTQID